MFIEAVILGIIIGFVRNGSIRNISVSRIRGWYLILLAFLIQIVMLFLPKTSAVASYGKYFYIVSLLLIIITLLMNSKKKGVWIILIGAVFNLIVMFMNGFKMPIYLDGLNLAGLQNMMDAIRSGDIINYMPISEVTNWTKYLGKYIVIPKPYPMAKVISIGDILMSLGIVMFVQGEMIKSYLTMRNRMINMGYKPKL